MTGKWWSILIKSHSPFIGLVRENLHRKPFIVFTIQDGVSGSNFPLNQPSEPLWNIIFCKQTNVSPKNSGLPAWGDFAAVGKGAEAQGLLPGVGFLRCSVAEVLNGRYYIKASGRMMIMMLLSRRYNDGTIMRIMMVRDYHDNHGILWGKKEGYIFWDLKIIKALEKIGEWWQAVMGTMDFTSNFGACSHSPFNQSYYIRTICWFCKFYTWVCLGFSAPLRPNRISWWLMTIRDLTATWGGWGGHPEIFQTPPVDKM